MALTMSFMTFSPLKTMQYVLLTLNSSEALLFVLLHVVVIHEISLEGFGATKVYNTMGMTIWSSSRRLDFLYMYKGVRI